MRIAVIGAGAVGGYFGGRLAESGVDVTFLARGETLAALHAHGLRVDSPKGDIVLETVSATDRPADIGPVDVALVAVKTWQISEVAAALGPLVGSATALLPLENGVEATDELAAIHGEEHVLGGTCRILAYRAGPGHVVHAGIEPSIAFGELDNRHSERVAYLLHAFRQAGVGAVVPDNIRSAIWQKFLFLAPVSGIGAVTRAPIGVTRVLPETRALLQQAMEEVAALAAAHRIPLAGDIVPRTLAFLDGMPAESTASMQRDVMEGRPSELEAINGAVVRIGHRTGVDVPLHAFIYASLLPQETRARAEAQAR
jgi:2-dehydropantoate 2-reductase